MISFTIPAFMLILFATFLAGVMIGVWIILTKIK